MGGLDITEECNKLKDEQQLWEKTFGIREEARRNPWNRILKSSRQKSQGSSTEKQDRQFDQNPIDSLRDVVESVQDSRSEWKGQKRMMNGKIQGGFQKLFKALDGYSNVLTILPSNEYTSLFVGAVKTLVKVRLSHLP